MYRKRLYFFNYYPKSNIFGIVNTVKSVNLGVALLCEFNGTP